MTDIVQVSNIPSATVEIQEAVTHVLPSETVILVETDAATATTINVQCDVTTLVTDIESITVIDSLTVGPAGPAGPAGASIEPTQFSFGDVSPRKILTLSGAHTRLRITVYLDNAFNGSGAAISIGSAGIPNTFLPTGSIDVSTPAIYEFALPNELSAGTELYLWLTPGSGAVSGSGSIVFST